MGYSAPLVRPARRLHRHTDERIGVRHGHQQHGGAGRRAGRHRHRRPVRDDDPAVNSSTATITLSANATVSGPQSLTASTPANVIPFQGDFDGDGKTDLAYYQPSTATWYMYDSKSKTTSSFALGTPNSSVPVVGYFDANAPEEAAVYTVVNGQGVWTIASAITGLRTVTFGQAGDIPVPGDYDGVGYDEIAVYRPSTGQFLVMNNGTN